MDDLEETRRIFFRQYQDRGVRKWQGFFLSEHTSALSHMFADELKYVAPKPEMTNQEIDRVIYLAKLKTQPVAIQLNSLDIEGRYSEDIVGLILGHSQAGLHIGEHIIEPHLIRNIEIVSFEKWSTLSSNTRTD